MVSVVDPASSNWVDGSAAAGAAVPATAIPGAGAPGAAAPGMGFVGGNTTRAVTEPALTTVVAGLEVDAGLAAALAAIAAPAAATTIGTVPPAGFGAGKLPPGRTALGGRLGLTVIRAVSLGGAVFTMEVPDLPLG